jgi:hypothetical protein
LWLDGEGIRPTERHVGVVRKTVRGYVEAAVELGLVRDDGDEQLTDVFLGLVVEAVRPNRTDGEATIRRRGSETSTGSPSTVTAWDKRA